MAKYRFTSEHKINLPTIRIASIELENFKSVKHGVISFNCGKKYIPFGTQSDILGIYGQNGSGKTSAIEAISILKYLLSGKAVPDEYSDCVDIHEGYAAMSFTLDVQYPAGGNYPTNDDIRKVVYSVKIAREEKEKDDIPHIFIDNTLDDFIPTSKYRVVVFDEVLKHYALSYELVKVKTTNMGSLFRLTYDLILKDVTKEKELVDRLRCRNGNLEITISRQETSVNEL